MQIRISTAAPPSDFLTKALNQLKADIDQAAVGLDVSVHPASTLFKQGTEVPALQRGNLEMSTMTSFEIAQQVPELGYFNRAYLLRDYAQLRRVFDGPIGDDFRKTVADKMGIQIIATHYLGTRQVNLRQKRDVKGPADLAGVKMRMPAGPEWLLLGRTLGVTPVPLGMPEVYLALKTGTVDGQENPLSILNAAKFYEVSEQIVLDRAYGAAGVFRRRQAGLGRTQCATEKGVRRRIAEGGKKRRRGAARRRGRGRCGAQGQGADGRRRSISRRSARLPTRSMPNSDLAKQWDAAGLAARAEGLKARRMEDDGSRERRAGRSSRFAGGAVAANRRLDRVRHVRRGLRHLQLQDFHPLFRA